MITSFWSLKREKQKWRHKWRHDVILTLFWRRQFFLDVIHICWSFHVHFICGSWFISVCFYRCFSLILAFFNTWLHNMSLFNWMGQSINLKLSKQFCDQFLVKVRKFQEVTISISRVINENVTGGGGVKLPPLSQNRVKS